jgi:diguanylate cyclase (GGDEF)-like protein
MTSPAPTAPLTREAQAELEARAKELADANASLQDMTETLAARIQELESERARVMHIGRTDSLTGLMNRGAFLSGLAEKLQASARFGTIIALYVIDLDRFKEVNDTLGHEAGDIMLQEVGARLDQVARENDVVARLGGDEFAIIAEMKADGADINPLANRLLEALTSPMTLLGRNVTPGASVGVALYPRDAQDAADLQRFADMALYRAKTLGRGKWSAFDASLREEGEQRRSLEMDLRRAVSHGEITPWFQPVVDASTGKVTGVEVLARWRHPEQGLIPPVRFVPLAEEMGIIGLIDEAVFDQACQLAAPWIADGVIDYISCNVSPRELLDADFAQSMIDRIEACAFPPSGLVVEITETFLLQDMDLAKRHIARLAEHGVKVALDDFGIGYSNLRALMQLPIDTVKLDRSLTVDIAEDNRVNALVRMLVHTTRALGLTVVAEGVESEEHAIALRATGCTRMQGYWFARPMPAADMNLFLKDAAIPVVGRKAA